MSAFGAGTGGCYLMKTAKDAFLLKEWLAADADERPVGDISFTEGVSCDDEGCVVQMRDGGFVSLSLKPDGLADDCERAALIVSAKPVPPGCAATVIDIERVRRQGAMALRRTKGGFFVDAVKPCGVNRPWAPTAEGEGETEPAIRAVRPAAPRAVDATPSESGLQSED